MLTISTMLVASLSTNTARTYFILTATRNVLEWRLDPTSPYRIADADPDRPVIVVCNEGFSSSLAAHTLQGLGLPHATDLAGGYQAWLQLPLAP